MFDKDVEVLGVSRKFLADTYAVRPRYSWNTAKVGVKYQSINHMQLVVLVAIISR